MPGFHNSHREPVNYLTNARTPGAGRGWPRRFVNLLLAVLILGTLLFGSSDEIQAARAEDTPAPVTVTCHMEQTPLYVGGQTDLVIEVKNVTNLYGYQLELNYDPDLVEILDSDPTKPGVNLSLENIAPPMPIFQQSNQASNGLIQLVVTLTGQVPGFSGDVVIARGSMRGLKAGLANFQFGQVILAEFNNPNAIPSQTLDCSGEITTNTPTPTGTNTPTPTGTNTPTPTGTNTTLPPTNTPTPTNTPAPGTRFFLYVPMIFRYIQ